MEEMPIVTRLTKDKGCVYQFIPVDTKKFNPCAFYEIACLFEGYCKAVDLEEQREILFQLTTKYSKIIHFFYSPFFARNPLIKEQMREVVKSTGSVQVISGFESSGAPYYQLQSFLLPRIEQLTPIYPVFFLKMKEYNQDILRLNQMLKCSDREPYDKERDSFVEKYIDIIERKENRWAISYFGLQKMINSRKKDL